MRDSAVSQHGREWLQRQLEELGGLYNAGTRSSNFKQWRQATLTVIQRVWPGDGAKSERFRRVPFSAPMGRPNETESREYYERGCAEAATYLKALLQELETVGAPDARANAEGGAAHAPLAEEDFPTVELPPAGASAAPPERVEQAQAPPRPGLSLPEVVANITQGEVPARRAPPPAPAKSNEHSGKVSHKLGRSSKKNGTRQRLREMLGFGDANTEPPPAAEAPPPPPDVRPRPTPPPADVAPPEFMVPPPPPPPRSLPTPVAPAFEPAPMFEEPFELEEPNEVPSEYDIDADMVTPSPDPPPPAPAEKPPVQTADEEVEAAERATEEFLRTSPVLTSQPRAARREPGPVPMAPTPAATPAPAPAAPYVSGVAVAIAALASEVDKLGVPDGHRARARAALLDLARQLDHRDLKWDSLREAVYFVMEFPALGRRVLPLLLPYLDLAA